MNKLSLVPALVVAALASACSSEPEHPAYCASCYSGDGAAAFGGFGGFGGNGGSALASSGGAPECQGVRGAPMVLVTPAPDVAFCIDTREAIDKEWNVFLKYAPDKPNQAAPCEDNDGWSTISDSSLAANNVDWCDAKAFCEWEHKRLCGRVGDGSVITTETDALDAKVDEWLFTCTNGAGPYAYPYGNIFVETICNTHVTGNYIDPPMTEHPDCHGIGTPYASIFDMSGNVAEWTNWCEPDPTLANGEQYCYLRGGDFQKPTPEEAGKCRYWEKKKRVEPAAATMGIRCCADPDLSAIKDGGSDGGSDAAPDADGSG